MLKKGPQVFCCWCTKALFREAIVTELPVHIMVRNPDPDENEFNQIQPTTILHFCGNSCLIHRYNLMKK